MILHSVLTAFCLERVNVDYTENYMEQNYNGKMTVVVMLCHCLKTLSVYHFLYICQNHHMRKEAEIF